MPQGVRRGAQGPVVHRLPLEKGLPALPRLENEPSGRTCANRDIYRKENTRIEIKKNKIFCVFFFLFFLFVYFRFFPKRNEDGLFVYLCISILKPEVCDGAVD